MALYRPGTDHSFWAYFLLLNFNEIVRFRKPQEFILLIWFQIKFWTTLKLETAYLEKKWSQITHRPVNKINTIPQTFVCKTKQWETPGSVPRQEERRGGVRHKWVGLAPQWRRVSPERPLLLRDVTGRARPQPPRTSVIAAARQGPGSCPSRGSWWAAKWRLPAGSFR